MTGRTEIYDREWTTERGLPPLAQLRIGLTKERGTPVKFLIQLEYWHAGEWLEVARFDHDRDSGAYHNVEQTGLHLDVYHPDDGKIRTDRSWLPEPAHTAMGRAERYIRKNAEQYVRRFETWL